MHFSLCIAAGALVFALTVAQNNSDAISLNVPTTPPPDTSQRLDASFAGFGIEPSNLLSFTGGPQTNHLSVNLLQNLADYTGTPPAIRLGGNTGDYFVWQDSHNDFSVQQNDQATGQGAFKWDSMIIGPSYFKALDRFPKNTPVIFGINMAYNAPDYMDQITTTAKAALSVKNVKLSAFEIGNEPDLYSKNGFRTGTWDGPTYTQQWLTRAQTLFDRVLKPANLPSNFFEPTATASTIGTPFEIKALVADGITAQANDSTKPLLAAWNQHDYYYYIGVSTYDLTLEKFTDLSTTVSQFEAWTTQVSQGIDAGYPYYLREMAAVGPVGMDGITNTFAASLWTLNFFLYTASLNISGVNFHMTDNSNASAWQPIQMYDQKPHVRPSYYAFAAMAQLIGAGGDGCDTSVAALPAPQGLPSEYENRLNAYATYRSNGGLAAITLINTRLPSSSSSPSTTNIRLSVGSSLSGTNFTLSRLTGPSADAKDNTTWNGISYEQTSDGKSKTVSDASEVVTVSNDGTLVVPLRDSEAVVVNKGAKIGGSGDKCSGVSLSGKGKDGGDQGGSQAANSDSNSGSASASGSDSPTLTASQTGATHTGAASPSISKSFSGPITMAMVLVSVMFGLW
ncbi:MAG: hypothetical protein Q9160_006784 [Pyrenula sp. 1 TL-2023]